MRFRSFGAQISEAGAISWHASMTSGSPAPLVGDGTCCTLRVFSKLSIHTMASPTKRRKKNDGTAMPEVGARNLDFFFKKKCAGAETTGKKVADVGQKEGGVSGGANSKNRDGKFTDEELARRLHEEWNGAESVGAVSEDLALRDKNRSSDGIKIGPASTAEEGSPSEKDDTKSDVKPPIASDETPKSNVPVSLASPSLDADKAHSDLPLDQDPLTFDPELYGDLIHSFPNSKATYALLTRGFVLITSTRSRIKIVDTIVNLLRVIIRHDPASLLSAVWLSTNSIGPDYENSELGLGGSILSKAILKVSGISKQALKTLNNKYGDPGDVAFDAKVKQRTLGMKKMVPLSMHTCW